MIDVNPHECNLCTAVFYDHAHLATHVNITHSSNWNGVDGLQNLVGCVFCGRAFDTKTKMLQHIIDHQTDGSASKAQILKVFDENLGPFEEPIFVIEEAYP